MREHSRYELQQKLGMRGFDEVAVADALDRLVEQGYLDDQRFAEMISRQYDHLGRRGLANQMTKRGIAPDIASPLIEAVGDDQEHERALSSAMRKGRSVPTDFDERQKWRRRTAGSLMRRGFSPSIVARVLSQMIDQFADEEDANV